MSDRFAFHGSKEDVESLFEVSTERDDFFESNYNINPGTLSPAVFQEEGNRRILNFYWGLIPPNADAEREGKDHYATRMEDVEDHEWLAECYEQRRCIVLAKGFFKWKTTKKKNTPFFIRLLSNEIMGLAGIYSVWEAPSGREVYSFSLLTTKANALVQPVDERMPVILRQEIYQPWLSDKKMDEATLEGLLKPYLLTEMAVNRVSEKVNDIANNSAELIQPIPK